MSISQHRLNLESIYANCRAMNSEDVIDTDDKWVQQKITWLGKAIEDMQLTIQQIDKQIEESRQTRLATKKLRDEVKEIMNNINAVKPSRKQQLIKPRVVIIPVAMDAYRHRSKLKQKKVA